jgi:hypothetical protein
MLTFKNYIDKGYFIDHNGHVVPSKPISIVHKKDKRSGIKEDARPETSHLHTLPGQSVEGSRLDHFMKKSDEIHASHGELEKKDQNAIHKYSAYNRNGNANASARINTTLISNHEQGLPATSGLSTHDAAIHKRISGLASTPMGREAHVYSGMRFVGEKAAKESKILYSPSHISTSHDVDIARNFAKRKGIQSRGYDIMHVHLKPKDKAFHVGNRSLYQGEHETIIPAGTKLTYSHTTHHHDDNGEHYRVHHYTVDSQE